MQFGVVLVLCGTHHVHDSLVYQGVQALLSASPLGPLYQLVPAGTEPDHA